MSTTPIHVGLKLLANLPMAGQAALLADEIVKQVDQANYNQTYLKTFKKRIMAHQENLKKYPPKEELAYKNYVAVLKEILEYIKEVRKPGSFSQKFLIFFQNVIKAGEVSFSILLLQYPFS